MIAVVKSTLHLVSWRPMPILLIVVAVALALGGALYYKSSSEVTSNTDAEPATPSGIADMLGDAEAAAEAMSDGMGNAMDELAATEGTTPTVTPTTNTPTEPTTTATESTYADGTYTMSGAYVSPAGRETVTVSVTLANDIITDASFTGDATNPSSVRNQGRFAEGYSALVVGKDIDTVELGVVNGSSLTGIGFNDALTQIKADARI